ncbi:MAG: rhomboid family intramembrane serine protease [Chloroflexi bacterium]|nr:rhomboid family intramembrane serine protease [Chloroflexota bacterium]
MIPISQSVPTRRTPWITLGLLLATLLVFLLELAMGPARDLLIRRWGAVPSLILAALGGDPRVPSGVLATLVTSQFLHGGWLHLGANLVFLWVFGRAVEDRLGPLRYLLFYLAWGAGAALVHVWVSGPSTVPLIGASGAIAGVLGAYFVLYPSAWVSLLVPILFFFWVIDVPAILALAYWFVAQFLSGMAAITHASSATDGVAFWAHIGGFGLGILALPFFPGQKAAPGRAAGPGALRGRRRAPALAAGPRRAPPARPGARPRLGLGGPSDLLLELASGGALCRPAAHPGRGRHGAGAVQPPRRAGLRRGRQPAPLAPGAGLAQAVAILDFGFWILDSASCTRGFILVPGSGSDRGAPKSKIQNPKSKIRRC